MIIGKEFKNFQTNKSFENKRVTKKPISAKDIFTQEPSQYKYTNPLNKSSMNEKALAVLNDRLKKGTITLEEFQKKCNTVAKNNR